MNQVLPGVSVILPILNEERDLDQSISAILQQQYPSEFEVILALGPSTDRTNEIAKALANRDPRVILVENPTGRTANGLNTAIEKARYPIISRIDGHAEISDTYLLDAVTILLKTGAVNVGGIMAAAGKTEVNEIIPYVLSQIFGALVAIQVYIRFKI
jgi:glycosyltransferase involved in cell wall biosynthesis